MMVTPAEIPATMPEALTDPVPGELLIQVPPEVASVSVNDNPTHTFAAPATTGAGSGFTVAIAVVKQPVNKE